MTPLLRVDDLYVEYPTGATTVCAVNGVSFEVAPGESVGIVGETGCGKSATVRALLGLLARPGRVVQGSAEFDGRSIFSRRPRELRRMRATQVAFVPQNAFGALNPVLRIARQFDQVMDACAHLPSSQRRPLAADLLSHVGIVDPHRVLRSYAFELSGGMAQRVVLAMAMARRPRLIVADEPTTGLDLTVLRQVMDLLKTLQAENSSALLMVTHDLGVVAHYCDHVLVMYAGQIVEAGPVESVFHAPAHPYTRALLGAVPKRGADLVALPGTVRGLSDRPTRCVFFERCPQRSDDRCASEPPPLRAVAPGHLAATFCDPAAAAQG